MKYRVGIWATAGLIVGVFWAIYFAMVSKDVPINPTVYALANLTCPLALVGSHFHFGVKLSAVLITNVAFYGLFGLIVESLRRQFHHAKQSNT